MIGQHDLGRRGSTSHSIRACNTCHTIRPAHFSLIVLLLLRCCGACRRWRGRWHLPQVLRVLCLHVVHVVHVLLRRLVQVGALSSWCACIVMHTLHLPTRCRVWLLLRRVRLCVGSVGRGCKLVDCVKRSRQNVHVLALLHLGLLYAHAV